MRVEIAPESGFCFGVRRALALVASARRRSTGPFYTVGPLIHNPQVVERLRDRYGMTPVENVRQALGGILVIRTHGVSPTVYDEAAERGIEVLDATCPFVLRVQHQARELASGGYELLLLGESHHPEVEAVMAHAGSAATVISSPDDLPDKPWGKVGLVVQTTQEPATLAAVAGALAPRCAELRAYNTICQATRKRQEGAFEVASRSDVMVVVGGRNSANTRRLCRICERLGRPTHHIEVAEEFRPEWLRGARSVGITGGASTPRAEIRRVAGVIRRMSQAAG